MNARELERLKRRFEKAQRRGRVKVLPPLPWTVRVRLSAEHRVNRLGGWLVKHDHPDAAVLLWRACGMW